MAKTMLDYALHYRRKYKFSVIPCKRDKRPLLKWEPMQLQKPSEDEIKQWWGKWQDANIAIACGPVSGIDVLDVDTAEAYEILQDTYLSDNFVTPTVKTPKGRHLYFRHKPGLSNSVRVVPGTDLRTQGGYVLAPPSRNGGGNGYYWHEGLSLRDVELAEWPEQLFAVLQQGSYNNSIYISNKDSIPYSVTRVINSKDHAKVGNNKLFFTEGRRDQDIFHAANCLTKGGSEKEFTTKVIEILANNCEPKFPENEIQAKIESALSRQKKRDGNLAQDVRDFVLSTNGNFLSTEVYKSLHLSTREDQKNLSIILKRMQVDGIIEKAGKRNGEWRLLDQDCAPMDWINADCKYKELWLPLGLGDVCGVQPGNILVFAGAKDSGKTAFLMNVAKENRHNYKVHFFNSEMGAAEFKLRATNFPDITIKQWADVAVYERTDNFADVIKPGEGNLNIIDFLEVVDEFWKVAKSIQDIHKKLDGALAVIAIQKNPKAELGRGGAFSLEKARLYISLDYNVAKIVSCKNFKENLLIQGNPRGYTCRYKLVQGCQIQRQHPGWTSPIETEAK